jgi:hypothetical protein
MTDKNLNDKKYDAIDPDSIIDLKINGKLFGDLRAMFLNNLLKDRNKEQIAQVFDNFAKKQVADESEYQLYILFQFIIGIEEQAKAQGYILKESVPDITKDLPD